MIQEVFDFSAEPQTIVHGNTFVQGFDAQRLGLQARHVYEVMSDGRWYTLSEIEDLCRRNYGANHSQTGISARIRGFRDAKNGGFRVESQRRGNVKSGLWEYQLLVHNKGE